MVHHRAGVVDLRSYRRAHCIGPQRHARQELRRVPLQQPELRHLLFLRILLYPLHHDDVPLL